jgi:hypothetical protein
MAPIENVGGEWANSGDPNQPCAIFQNGRMLLVVNEHGALATALAVGPTTLQILQGGGWQPGLAADLQDPGTLVWRNGGFWRR